MKMESPGQVRMELVCSLRLQKANSAVTRESSKGLWPSLSQIFPLRGIILVSGDFIKVVISLQTYQFVDKVQSSSTPIC